MARAAVVCLTLWLLATALVVHVGMAGMYKLRIEKAKVTGEQPYPLASTTESRLPPEPRLQQFPRTEYYEHFVSEQQRLHNYGWVNKDAGVVHITARLRRIPGMGADQIRARIRRPVAGH